MNIFQRFFKSLYDFDEYYELSKTSGFKVIAHTILISIIMVLIALIPISSQFFKIGGITGFLDKTIPDFNIENGILSLNKTLDEENTSYSRVIIDTENEHKESEIDGYKVGIIIDKNGLITKNGKQKAELKASDLESIGIKSKDDIIKFVPIIRTILIATGVVSVFWVFIANLCSAVLFSVLGNFINLFVKTKINSFEMIKVSTYARSSAALLKVLITAIGFMFSGIMASTKFQFYMPSVVYIGVVGCFLYLALNGIKKTEVKIEKENLKTAKIEDTNIKS